jgi:hypothetical protein
MSISNSPVAIFQHHQRIEFTFYESRACLQYSDFLDRAKQLMQKRLKQGYDEGIYEMQIIVVLETCNYGEMAL